MILFGLFVVLDILFQDGERSFGAVADVVITVVALVLSVAAPVTAFALSCLACRRSRRWSTLIPAGLLVALLGWWAVGLADAGSSYWWLPGLAAAAGAVAMTVSFLTARPGGR